MLKSEQHAKNSDNALSNVLDSVLLVALTAILCAVFLAILLGMIPEIEFKIFNLSEERTPEILAITAIHHIDEDGRPNYDSRLDIKHVGNERLFLQNYSAEIYVNGKKQPVVIKTLRSTEMIGTSHIGVQVFKGPGVSGYYWEPAQTAILNLKNRIIDPEENIELRILRNSDNEIISRSFMRAPS